MSKRQTLSERFDNIAPPKYDDMSANGLQADVLEEDIDSQPTEDTTFTVVNNVVRNSRNQRISHVMDTNAAVATTVPGVKYAATRETGTRSFRRELNTSPYFAARPRPPFRTNRATMMTNPRVTGLVRNKRVQRFNENYVDVPRNVVRNRGFTGRFRSGDFGARFRGPRQGFEPSVQSAQVGPGGGPRGRGRGRARRPRGGVFRGRGRGDGNGNNAGKNPQQKRGWTKEQLDKDLDQYYADSDPQKFKEMKNDELDKELDDYWSKPQKEAKNDADNAINNSDNSANTQKSSAKARANQSTVENSGKSAETNPSDD